MTLGLGFGLYIQIEDIIWGFIAAVIIGTIGWSKPLIRIGLLVSMVFGGSVALAQVKRPLDLSQYYNQKSKLDLRIIDDPVFSEKSTRFTARIDSINDQQVKANLLVTMPRYPEYSYADALTVQGEMNPISEFNLKANASGEIVFPQVNETHKKRGSVFKKTLYDLKRLMLKVTGMILPEPHAGLLGGLLLGTKSFSPELSEQFRVTGTAHIVAISGFNVTIVAGIMDGLLRRFGRSVSFYGSLLGIVSLVVITGAQASVARAGVMGGLVLVAQRTGRVYASLNALFVTSSFMLFQNPKLLVFDIGFQLSFAALSGLMFVQPQLDENFPKFPLKEFLFPTIAAQITTTPLLLYHFGNFSFISVATNLLVLPIIPWAMLVGFISVLVAMVTNASGLLFGSVTWMVLTYIIKVIDYSSKLPGASVSNIPFPMWMAIMYYLVLVFYLKWKPKLSESSNLS